jgi:hypothetical protein
VTQGSKGVEWEFDPAAVQDWLARFWSRPGQVVTRNGLQTFSTSEQAEVVKALGHIIRNVGTVAAEMSVEAGASIPMAYALDQMVCLKLSDVAEAYLAEHGVRGVDLVETFLRPGDETDWSALAEKAGSTFDEDACETFLAGIECLQPSPEVLDAQAAWLRGHERTATLKEPAHG